MVKKLQALKAKKGFTLVELIVVIAIIGVLAAILVPVMMGQVQKAKMSSLNSTASTILTAVNTWIADRYTHGVSGGVDGTYTFKVDSGSPKLTPPTGSKTDEWYPGNTGNTGLEYALKEAYSLGTKDCVAFWIAGGKCVAAAFMNETVDTSKVSYTVTNGVGAWSGVGYKDASAKKDGIVTVGADGGMIGTSPQFTSEKLIGET